MMPDRVSNPGPLTFESGALPIAQREMDNFFQHYSSPLPYPHFTREECSNMGASATEIQFTDVFFVLTPCVVAQAIQTLFHHSDDKRSIFIFIINLFQSL